MNHQLTLFHYWRSSCSWRVRWAMNLKKLAYESVPVDLLSGEQKTPEFLKKNPLGYVPVLLVNGKAYGESMAIIEWLDETYKTQPLLPQDSEGRLIIRQLYQTIMAGTQPLQNLKVLNAYSDDPEKREKWAQMWIRNGLEAYETLLRHHQCYGTYSFKSSISMADLCLVPQVYNADRYKVNMNEFPLCKRIYEACLKTPDCDKAAPHNQPGAK